MLSGRWTIHGDLWRIYLDYPANKGTDGARFGHRQAWIRKSNMAFSWKMRNDVTARGIVGIRGNCSGDIVTQKPPVWEHDVPKFKFICDKGNHSYDGLNCCNCTQNTIRGMGQNTRSQWWMCGLKHLSGMKCSQLSWSRAWGHVFEPQ